MLGDRLGVWQHHLSHHLIITNEVNHNNTAKLSQPMPIPEERETHEKNTSIKSYSLRKPEAGSASSRNLYSLRTPPTTTPARATSSQPPPPPSHLPKPHNPNASRIRSFQNPWMSTKTTNAENTGGSVFCADKTRRRYCDPHPPHHPATQARDRTLVSKARTATQESFN